MNVREEAYLSLEKCAAAGRYSNIEVDTVLRRSEMSENDRSLYTALVYGTIEKQISLDYVIGLYSKIPPEKLESKILWLLRLGAYQILYLDKVPDSAACNETVKLCKKYSHKGADGFVNAVLRSISRNKDKTEYPDKEKDRVFYLSVKYGVSRSVIEMWDSDYGEETTEKILSAFDTPPYMTLRTNTLVINREELLKELSDAGYEAEKTAAAKYGIRLKSRAALGGALGNMLADGKFTVQDESSQLCAELLGALRGETLMDICAAPGGKSFASAMGMENEGRIYSFDLHENKISLIKKGAERLKINIIEARCNDGTVLLPEFAGKADRVLCDVPCSGLGVLAKKPDLRTKERGDIERLPEIQYKILKVSSEYVREGGVLLYSTCTLNKAENEKVVLRFLSENHGFLCEEMRTVFPYEYGSDGFFTAKLIKKV